MIGAIGLDAGHGGRDRGVVSRCGLEEARLALDVAQLTQDYCQRLWSGAERIVLLRSDDESDPSLRTRNTRAKQMGVELVISIHANASLQNDQRGALTLHYPGNLRGRAVADAINRALPIRPITWNSPPATPSLWPRAFNVVSAYKATAVLVELGYLDRENEAAQLSQFEVQESCALSIALGISIWRRLRLPF